MAEQTDTDVVIVGAGPSGLALAIALAHHEIRSIVVEKNTEITEDPRAIAIAGDTTRILEVLGISERSMTEISQVMPRLQFHLNTFTSPPFHNVQQDADWLEQVLPTARVLLQPGLGKASSCIRQLASETFVNRYGFVEKILRQLVQDSAYAELCLGCEVTSIEELPERVKVRTLRKDSSSASVTGKFLVAADGKRGYVRKNFLEEKGIEQQIGIYPYQATWVAANLYITLPTPESHPSFPLWQLGYKSEELWDIFWPAGFHFCCHPTMPIAAGRFGPVESRYWRFEYELPNDFACTDLEQHLLDQIRPHMTIAGATFSRNEKKLTNPVQFPQDCIRILRCERANFNNRVVNKWYYNRVILIGDAAHVFPPFGAQGIANGIRDAFGLSWRLGFLLRTDKALKQEQEQKQDKHQREVLLQSWAEERREGVDDSSRITQASGTILLGKSRIVATILGLGSMVLEYVPRLRDWVIQKQLTDAHGFRGAQNGFFLDGVTVMSKNNDDAIGGGRKTAQIYMEAQHHDSAVILSDKLFWQGRRPLTLLLLRNVPVQVRAEILLAIKASQSPTGLLADDVLLLHENDTNQMPTEEPLATTFKHITPSQANPSDGPGLPRYYDSNSFRGRFEQGTLYALIRPDFIIFSQGCTVTQLQKQLELAETYFFDDTGSLFEQERLQQPR